jgi:hypothetical protein
MTGLLLETPLERAQRVFCDFEQFSGSLCGVSRLKPTRG